MIKGTVMSQHKLAKHYSMFRRLPARLSFGLRRLQAIPLLLLSMAAHGGEIVVAQVAPFSGGLAMYSKEISLGASVFFDLINAQGGVGGSPVRLVTRDDRMDPQATMTLYHELASTERPVAFMYPVGPVAVASLLEKSIPQELQIPMIGTVPALYKLRNPVNPYVFNIGVGDDAELEKIVEHIATVGIRNIGVVHWNEPAALEALAFIENQAGRHGLHVTLKAPVEAGTDHVDNAVSQVLRSSPGALIAILPTHATGALVKQLRRANNSTPIYGPSYTESSFLAEVAGNGAAHGVAISQVVPNPFSRRTALVRQYQDGMRRYAPPGTRLSTLSLEGFIAAKILVQGMQRIGTDVTGPRLRASLEKMQNVDLGGLTMSYAPSSHIALRFLDIAMVSTDGGLIY